MAEKDLLPGMAEKMQQMLVLIHQQDEQIYELKNRLTSDSNAEMSVERYFNIYGKFIRTVHEQGLAVPRKYRTENSRNYIDVPYAKYLDFVARYLEKEEYGKFKEFLNDFQLMESGTFNGSGLYTNTSVCGRTRVVRIRFDIYKWIS